MSGMLVSLLLALQAAPPSLPAPDSPVAWELVDEGPDGRVRIDPASIRRDGEIVRVHVRLELSATRQLFLMRQVIDCAGGRAAFEGGALYDEQGRVTMSREDRSEALEWKAIEPGSVESLFHQRLCGPSGGLA